MNVELVDRMGSDVSVVNAARVSYGKQVTAMSASDRKLLKYLANHKHWTPFAHPQLSFRIKASIAVARQLFRHTVGLAINETSRRYVTDEPEFDLPDVWRRAPGKGQSKQGSGEPLDPRSQNQLNHIAEDAQIRCQSAYQTMIDVGVAPEQARLVLPMSLLTEWLWTGSLYAFIRICKERLAPDAQSETRAVAEGIYGSLREHFPDSMKAWAFDREETVR